MSFTQKGYTQMIELNPDYSTTRLVTHEVPIIEEPPDAAFKTVLFLPEGEERQGEGGLRTQGCFKRSLTRLIVNLDLSRLL